MDKWILNEDEYSSLIFSRGYSFTYTYDSSPDIDSLEEETSSIQSKKEGGGDMVFGVKVDIPKFKDKFTLVLKSSDVITVYEKCTFNKTNFMDDYLNNDVMKSIERAEENEISIKYESTTTYTPEKYRKVTIDKIID